MSPVSLIKKCRHAKGVPSGKRMGVWKACGCKWLADLTVGGRRVWIDVGPDFQQARRRHQELVAARDTGRPVDTAPHDECSVEAVAGRWWAQKEPALAVNTRGGYRDQMRLVLEALAGADVRNIGGTVIADMEAALLRAGYAAGTVANARTVLYGILDRAQAEGLIAVAPRSAAPIARKQDEPRVLTPAQVIAILDVMDVGWRGVTEFTWRTGLRAGEALALDHDRLDGAVLIVDRQVVQRSGQMGAPKNNRARAVDLSPRCLDLIPDGGGVWFGGGYTAWLRRWHDALDVVGVGRCGLHVLRHSNVALRFAAGQTPTYVARQLGHSSAAFTLRRYGRWIPSERDDPARLDVTVRQLAASGPHGQSPTSHGSR